MIRRMRAAMLPADDASETGFTLVEMLVVVVIFGIIILMLGSWFVGGAKTTAKSNARNDDVFATRDAMLRLQRDLQLAVPDPNSSTAGPFISGSHDSVSFYANIDGLANPTKVTWAVTPTGTYDGTLTRTTVKPYVSGTTVTWPTTGTGASVTTQNVLTGVNDTNNGKTPAIFRFLDANNAQDPQMCVESATPSSCGTTLAVPLSSDPLSAAHLPTAVAVEIYLQVATAGDGVASNTAPYYETTKKTGSPTVLRARVYPASNTLTRTTS